MDVSIRPASREDADFLSWLILTAGRAHVKRGIWEVILGGPEEECLSFLKALAVTGTPHYFHHSCYLLAEVAGLPAAGLGGYDPRVSGDSALWQALPEVFGKMKGQNADAAFRSGPPKIVSCIPAHLEGAWVIDSVASKPRFRRQGLVSGLMEEMIERARQKGFRSAQINIYIGNRPAQRLYEKHGFKIVDEKRDPYFEAQIGSPGMARMVLEL